MKETTKPVAPFKTMSQEPWNSGKGAKTDHIIQLTRGEVRKLQNN